MEKRTKLILFIAIILAIVIIFGVGIGVNKGWFAGLADIIKNTSPSPGGVTVTVEVMDTNNNPISGVVPVITKPNNFIAESAKCFSTDTTLDPKNPKKNGDQPEYAMGQTGSDGKVTFGVSDANNVNYLRVHKEMTGYKSCAFRYDIITVTPPSGEKGVSGAFPNQTVVYFKKITSGSIYIKFHLRDSGGGGGEGETGSISGVVRYSDNGQAISGAVLSLYNANNQPVRLNGATTNATGDYSFNNLANNTYKVKVQGKSCFYNESSLEEVIVSTANPNPTKNISLTREAVPSGSAKIYGKVMDLQNNPIAGARIRLYRLPSLILPDETTTDAAGDYFFCPVTPGSDYKLNVSKEGYSTAEATITNLPQGQTNKDFYLNAVTQNASFNLKGTITVKYDCANEGPLSGATVTVLDENDIPIHKSDGSLAYDTTDNYGSYSFMTLKMIDPQNRIPAKIKVEKFGYSTREFPFTPQANTTVTVNGMLNSPSLKASISGRVTENNIPVSGAKIYLVDGTNQTQIATADNNGSYQKNDISSNYIGQEITIKATIERNGQKYSGNETVIFNCQNTVNISIVVPETKEVKVQVTKDGKGENGAKVTIEVIEGDKFVRGQMQTTSKISGRNGMALFQVANGSTFKFTAVKDNQSGKSENYSLPPFNPDRDIAKVALLGPMEGSENLHVVYKFHFDQQTDRGDTVVKQIFDEAKKTVTDWKKLVRIAFDPWYKFQWLGEEAYQFIRQFANKDKQEPATDFIKISKGLFNRANWKFVIAEWKLPDNIKQMIGAPDGIIINWGKLGFPRNSYANGTEGGIGENSSPEYRVDVIFPDIETKQAWVKKIFCLEGRSTWQNLTGAINDRNLNLKIDTNGDNGKIVFTKVKVSCSGIQPVGVDEEQGIDIYKVDVNLRYRFTREAARTLRQLLIDASNGMLSPEQFQGMFGGGVDLSPERMQAIIRAYQEGQQLQLNEGASATNSYPLEKGVAFIPEINPGKYQISFSGNDNYQIDNRTNIFEVKENSDTVTVEPKICYKDGVISESDRDGINFKTLGTNGMPYYLEDAVLRAKQSMAKAGVSNFVLLGNSYNAPESSSHAVNTNLKYCRAGSDPNAAPQDKQIRGRSIVIEMPFVGNVERNYSSEKSYLIASQVDRQAGFLIFNDFSNIQKSSWRKIVTATENINGTNVVYERIISASMIDDYISRENLYAKNSDLFALVVAAYKENGEIVKSQIDALTDNRQKNVMKAMVRFVIETVGANPGDENLYKTIGHISTAGYNPSLIAIGSIFQENFDNLPVNQRIQIRYIALLDAIRGSKPYQWIWNQINAFNDWVRSLRGTGDTGRFEVRVLRNNGSSVSDALVVAGQQDVICHTDSTGFCAMNVPVGDGTPKPIEIRNRQTNEQYQLTNSNLTATIRKNTTTSITARITE